MRILAPSSDSPNSTRASVNAVELAKLASVRVLIPGLVTSRSTRSKNFFPTIPSIVSIFFPIFLIAGSALVITVLYVSATAAIKFWIVVGAFTVVGAFLVDFLAAILFASTFAWEISAFLK